MAIDLRNISGKSQELMIQTNFFKGELYLLRRDAGERRFLHTNHWLQTQGIGYPAFQFVTLPSGATRRFVSPLTDFLDDERAQAERRRAFLGFEPAYPNLASQLQPGCSPKARLELSEPKPAGGGAFTGEKTLTLTSPILPYP